MEFVGGRLAKPPPTAGPLTPDQLVYCRSFPLWFKPIVDEAPAALSWRACEGDRRSHRRHAVSAAGCAGGEGLGMFTAGDDFAAAKIVQRVYTDAVKIMAGRRAWAAFDIWLPDTRDFLREMGSRGVSPADRQGQSRRRPRGGKGRRRHRRGAGVWTGDRPGPGRRRGVRRADRYECPRRRGRGGAIVAKHGGAGRAMG
jgi:hypothetical protein